MDSDLIDDLMDCEGCQTPTPIGLLKPGVPGDRNSAWVCLACRIEWLERMRWDDALGEWVATTRTSKPTSTTWLDWLAGGGFAPDWRIA